MTSAERDNWTQTGWVAQVRGTIPVVFLRDIQIGPDPKRFVNILPLYIPDPPGKIELAPDLENDPKSFVGSLLNQFRRRPAE